MSVNTLLLDDIIEPDEPTIAESNRPKKPVVLNPTHISSTQDEAEAGKSHTQDHNQV